MERRDKESRQSSLPSSLIPHLYSRPQHSDPLSTTAYQTILPLLAPVGKDEEAASTERTELPPIRSSFALPLVPSSFGPPGLLDDPRRPKYPNYETRLPAQHEQESNFRTASPADHPASGIIRSMGSLSLPSHVPSQRYASPIYSDPLYRTTRPERTFHGHSYPLASQETAVPRSSWREGEAGPSSLVHTIPHDIGGIRGRRGSSQPAQITRQSGTSNYRGGDVSDDEERRGRERERYLSEKDLYVERYGSWSESFPRPSTPPSHLESDRTSAQFPTEYNLFPLSSVSRTWSGTPTGGYDYPAVYSPGSISEISSDGRLDDGDDYIQKGKRRRESDDGGDSVRKSRNPRKTAVACNFCRGRKLRCNGAKPACSNCTVRKFQCEYVPVQRRRGPGKAPKGTKIKKGRSEPSTSLPPSNRTSGMMRETLPTEYGPTMSLDSERFSFEAPRSPSRRSRSRQRGRRDVTPSPEAESDAEKGY